MEFPVFTVSGKVVDISTGDGIDLAWITYTINGGSPNWVVTSADGSFTITVAGELAIISVDALGYVVVSGVPVEPFYRDATDILIQMRAAFEVSGTVEDLDGNPIAGAEVWFTVNGTDLQFVTTGADGTFAIYAQTGTVISITSVAAAGYLPFTAMPAGPFVSETKGLMIQMASPFDVAGRVFDTNGNPIPFAIVYYTVNGGGIQMVTADADGRFLITAGGPVVITDAGADGYVQFLQNSPDLAARGNAQDFHHVVAAEPSF